MYYLLFMPLVPALLSFMTTTLDTIRDYVAFYDIAFGGYAIFCALAILSRHWEKKFGRVRKLSRLYDQAAKVTLVFRIVSMTIAVGLLTLSSVISITGQDIPLLRAVMIMIWFVCQFGSLAQFVWVEGGFDKALKEDI